MINNSLLRRLQSGGSAADQVAPGAVMNASQAAPRLPTLTGLN